MSKTEIMNTLTRKVSVAKLKIKKHTPEIMLVAGTVGVVTSAVMACKATLKVTDVLDEAKNNLDKIHTVAEDPDFAEEYTPEDAKKDTAIVYAKTGMELVKLYGPAVLLGAASIGCLIGSHKIMKKRNVALAAAYMTEHTGFKEYRDRLIERFGADLDRELKYDIKTKEIEETIVHEDGTESTVKTKVDVAHINKNSQYDRFFDDGCRGWEKNAEMNLYRVKQVENWANDVLQSRKYLFLNEVYEEFGIPKTIAGQTVGWVYDEEHPTGDNYVDFGIFDLHNPEKRAFVNGKERVILLQFNVDGPIDHLVFKDYV